LRERLEGLRELGVVGDIRGAGLMVGVEFVRDPATMEPFPSDTAFGVRVGKNSVHKQKMLVRYSPNWIAVAPPFTITEDQIDEMVTRLGRAISEVSGELSRST
jgi:adenosylmethionine-8-amino-7-oxononanoate aminotransferase